MILAIAICSLLGLIFNIINATKRASLDYNIFVAAATVLSWWVIHWVVGVVILSILGFIGLLIIIDEVS